jgi:Cdc6-like AAA superfamily ATPase
MYEFNNLNGVAEDEFVADDQLSPEEQKELDRLTRAAEEQESAEGRFVWDDTFQQYVAGLLLSDEHAVAHCRRIGLRPIYFTDEVHQELVRFSLKYHEEYATLPARAFVEQHVQSHVEGKDAKVKYHWISTTNLVLKNYVPNLHDRPYLLDQITKFAKVQQTKLCINKFVASVKSGAPDYTTFRKELEEVEKIGTATNEKMFLTWDEFLEEADKESQEWLVPNWIEFGALTMLTGLPFSGKSSVVADLVAAISTNRLWCEMPVTPCHVILLDLENKYRITAKRIRRALGDEEGRISDFFHPVNRKLVRLPLSVENVESIISQLQAGIEEAEERSLVIVDTMRSVFTEANELDNDDMRQLLYPLQGVAQRNNAAILVLHHNSRGRDEYAGVGVIAGAVDVLLNWSSDRKSGKASLEMCGTRDEGQPTLEFLFDTEKQQNVFVGTSAQVTKAKRTVEAEEDIAPILAACPDAEFASRNEVVKAVSKQVEQAESTIRTKLDRAASYGWLETKREGKGIHVRLTDRGREIIRHWRGLRLIAHYCADSPLDDCAVAPIAQSGDSAQPNPIPGKDLCDESS